MVAMWGIHNDSLSSELLDEGFVSIGWEAIPDIRSIGNDRERLKRALEQAYPEAKAGAIPVWAGILFRFAFEMKEGDIVIAPYRTDSTLNFGIVTGEYEYVSGVSVHPHRRAVRWTTTGVSRGLFPQKALYEIGSALTLFRVKKNVHVFLTVEGRALKEKLVPLAEEVNEVSVVGLSEHDIKTARKVLLALIENLADDELGSTNPMRRVPSTRELGRIIAERGDTVEDR